MTLTFAREDRRDTLRDSPLNGIDEVEVADDRRTLVVRFFHDAPKSLGPRHLRVVGGIAVRGIEIIDIQLVDNEDPDRPILAEVSLDRSGDASTYELRVVDLEGFDPRYSAAGFTFFPDFFDDLDPVAVTEPPRETIPTPPLDYLAKDYAGFRQLILDRLAVTAPTWTERHIPDVGLMMVEMLAYTADRLSYYQDAVATEAYLGTARRRLSVKRHVRLIDYRMHEGCAARALVQIDAGGDVTVGTEDLVLGVGPSGGSTATFMPVPGTEAQLVLRQAALQLSFHDWGDSGCILSKGSRSATLIDPAPEGPSVLSIGDFLIFEIIDLTISDAPDADPNARHPVRLTEVRRSYDPLLKVALLEIAWSADDATPVDFPVDAALDAGVQHITVARGGLILAMEGRVVVDGDVATNELVPVTVGPGRRRALTLTRPGLAFAQSLSARDSASGVLTAQDPRAAEPLIQSLRSWPIGAKVDPATATVWQVKPDLIESGPDDAHATVEMDDGGVATLRFGDGVCGRDPSGQAFEIAYIIGFGAGAIGADRIGAASSASQPDAAGWRVRNPLAASGGAAPEPVSQVRLLAPTAFRDDIVRAVTADDYAALAVRLDPEVQRATCRLVPSGIRKIARVAIDVLGRDTPSPGVERRVAKALEAYRYIGHDVVVVQGIHTPLLLSLDVTLKPGHVVGHVRAALMTALAAGFTASGAPAPFNPDRLTFGTPIYGSPLIAAAQAVSGVESVEIAELARLFDRERGGYERGVLAMAWNEIPQLDNDPLRPHRGRLDLRLKGGRR